METKENKPDGATHYNKYQKNFPWERHTKKNKYVWANGKWEWFSAESCAVKIK